MKKIKNLNISYFARNFSIVVGLVLIWRGIWHVMDWMDRLLFDGDPVWIALGGIILGFIILYIPDKDLKEIGKL